MTSWNYRLVDEGTPEDPFIRVCEVYYNEAGEPVGYCTADVSGDTMEDAKGAYRMMAEAFTKPILPKSIFKEDI